ncbi:MAG: hypothetical protein AAF960_24295 [Bacteroidota bacterium]
MSTTTIAAKEQTIPKALIYEMDNGQPIYYRGYKQVLKKIRTVEEVTCKTAL